MVLKIESLTEVALFIADIKHFKTCSVMDHLHFFVLNKTVVPLLLQLKLNIEVLSTRTEYKRKRKSFMHTL